MILWANIIVILAVAAGLFFLFTETSKRSIERFKYTYKPYEKSDEEAIKEAWEDVGNALKGVMGIEDKRK